jgi:hypothetical protein
METTLEDQTYYHERKTEKKKIILSCISFLLSHSKSALHPQIPDMKSSCRFIEYSMQNS